MASFDPSLFSPSIRQVNSSLTVVRGPVPLSPLYTAGVSTFGFAVSLIDVQYPDETDIEFENTARDLRWRTSGYRPTVSIEFALLEGSDTLGTPPGEWGLSLIRRFHSAGIAAETFGAIQFNLFSSNIASPWRGFRVMSPWTPRWIGSKYTRGCLYTLELKAVSLISSPGDWQLKLW